MKLDQFAFANEQLAGMIRSGIPLEGALRELSENLSGGKLKCELSELEKDLAKGVPLEDALADRKLPDLYRQTLTVGAKSGDLPGVLTQLADHYARMATLADRTKVLLIYPVIVLLAATALSVALSVILTVNLTEILNLFDYWFQFSKGTYQYQIWAPTILIAGVTMLIICLIVFAPIRRSLSWMLPAFREVQIVNVASSLAVLLRGNTPLGDAVKLVRANTLNPATRVELDQWLERMDRGETRFHRIAEPSQSFPPLFGWAVETAGDNLADGFSRAAKLFLGRANYRFELLLNVFTPVSLVVLGGLIIVQALPVIGGITVMLDKLGSRWNSCWQPPTPRCCSVWSPRAEGLCCSSARWFGSSSSCAGRCANGTNRSCCST